MPIHNLIKLASQGSVDALDKIFSYAYRDDPQAQFALAQFYAKGTGVSRDYEESLAWLKHAANNHHHDAILELIKIYNQDDPSHSMAREKC